MKLIASFFPGGLFYTRSCLAIVLLAGMSACTGSRYIYVVRHAEKATVPATATAAEKQNPPLSEKGAARAQALQQLLAGKKITALYSTNYLRTTQTIQPVANNTHQPVVYYNNVKRLADTIGKSKKNILIAGHSNTVDDIVNAVMEKQLLTDLPETVYNKLFIIKQKGKKLSFKETTYGAANDE